MSDIKQEVLKTHILKSYIQVVKTFENMLTIEIQVKTQRHTVFFIKKKQVAKYEYCHYSIEKGVCVCVCMCMCAQSFSSV